MPTLEYSNGVMTLEIDYSVTGELVTDATLFTQFINSLQLLAQTANLDTFEMKEQSAGSEYFNYAFVGKDARTWNQVLHIQDTDASMTFSVASYWKLSEFVLHRPVRDLAIALVRKYGVSKIEASW